MAIRTKYLLLISAYIIVLVSGVRSKCGSRKECHIDSDALERYNRFIAAISKHRRSAGSKPTFDHEKNSGRKRSTGFQYSKSVLYDKPPLRVALHSSSVTVKSAYTTVNRNLADDRSLAALRARQQRIAQAQRLQILERIRHANHKPWWGQWTSWSACGRTCGCGVQFQERHCLGGRRNPAQGRLKSVCEGPTKRYKICNSAPCPTNAPSFRRLQCSQHAAKQVRGRYYTWKPYGHPVDEIVSNEPCQLVCVSDSNAVQINTVAMDGTECRKEWNDGRCVDGKCQLIGCDGKINSTNLRNRCGKCDGDATSCVVHHNTFSHSFTSAGELMIVRIPENAYDILINEKRKSSARITVKDDDGQILFDGSGGATRSDGWPRDIMISGAEFRYRKPESQAVTQGFEYLLSVGPLLSPIVVYVSARSPGNTLLRYEFKTPVIKNDSSSETEDHDIILTTDYATSDNPEIPIPSEAFSDSHFITTAAPTSKIPEVKVIIPPLIITDENIPVVEYSFIGDDTNDRADESEDFLPIREIETNPVETEPPTEGAPVTLQEAGSIIVNPGLTVLDNDVETPDTKPKFLKPAHMEGGNGDKTETIARVYTVERRLPPDAGNVSRGGNETDYEEIPSDTEHDYPEDGEDDYDLAPGVDIPIAVRMRNRFSARRYTGYQWRTSGFAPCSSTCTSGLRDSYATCERIADRLTVEDSHCNPTTRPEPVRRSCSNQTCDPRWEATPWSDCSRSCGAGVQMRTVRCWLMLGPGFDSTVYKEACNDVAGEKPAETKPCKIVEHCGPLWETSNWSPCPAPCGRLGMKWRTVRCSAGQERLCASAPRPHTEESCQGPKCVYTWRTTNWGQCSGDCGGGRKTRRVICADHYGRSHPEDHCDIGTKPATSHPCGDENCRPEWIAQDWEECSTECGPGIRTRKVLCSGIVNGQVHHYEDDSSCSGTPKPPVEETCQQRDCDPIWYTTSWSKCSVTCGSGHLVREVKCYLKNAPATGCDEGSKPSGREACNMPPCPAPPAAQCRNKPSVNCVLVVRVRLCSHWYYRKACCSSCNSRRIIGK